MKKLINLIALVMLVSTNVLTPFSYAEVENPELIPGSELETVDESFGESGETPEINEETSEVSEEIPEANPEEKGELEQGRVEDVAPENVLPDIQNDVETPSTDETEEEDTENNEVDQPVEEISENEIQDENLKGDEIEDDFSLQKEDETMIMQVQPGTIATLLPGPQFNQIIKRLAGNSSATYSTSNTTINQIIQWTGDTIPLGVTTTGISTSDSEKEILAWYDSGIIYYYTEAETIYMNPNSREMFSLMYGLEILEINNWDASKVTDMQAMFWYCEKLKSLNLRGWNTSNVTNMRSMFGYCKDLINLDISGWDTSQVTTMYQMFLYCGNLTELDVSNWNTSKVTNMQSMFYNCNGLTSLDVSNWNTSSVTNMSYMFQNCSSLTGLDVGNWNTSSVTNMSYMFQNCSSLTGLDVGNWNTSSVTNMSYMFQNCSSLTGLDVGNWNTSNVTNMSYMFDGCSKLMTLNMNNWNTSKVTSMHYMFYDCRVLAELDMSNWNTSNVTDMSNMFRGCYNLETIYVTSGFVTDQVTSHYSMFYNNTKLIGGNGTVYSGSKTNKIYANIDSQSQSGYFTSKDENLSVRFIVYPNIYETSVVQFGQKVSRPTKDPSKIGFEFVKWVGADGKEYDFNTQIEKYTEIYAVFDGNEAILLPGKDFNQTLKRLAGYDYVTYNDEDLGIKQILQWTGNSIPDGIIDTKIISVPYSDNDVVAWYDDGIIYYYTEAERIYMNPDPSYMFYYMQGLTGLDLSSFDTSKVTNMSYMFSNCTSLTGLDLSSFDTSKVTNMSYMFSKSLIELNLNGWDFSKLEDNYSLMCKINEYRGSSSLKKLNIRGAIFTGSMRYAFVCLDNVEEINLSGADTSNVTNMYGIFEGLENLKEVDISNWDTSNVTSMEEMFEECYNLNEIKGIEVLDTNNIKSVYDMFRGCKRLTSLDLSRWDTSNVTYIGGIFNGCTGLEELNLSGWDLSKVSYISASSWGWNDTRMPLKKLNMTNVKFSGNISSIFNYAKNLEELILDGVDTSNVTNMNNMFGSSDKLTNLDLSSFDTSKVTNMSNMFYDCTGLVEIKGLDNFDTSRVTNMNYMFGRCSGLTGLDLSSWDTSKVTNMGYMFNNTPNLKTIYASDKFVTSALTGYDASGTNMFYNSVSIIGGNGTKFDSGYTDKTYALIDKVGQTGYFTDKNAITVKFINTLDGTETLATFAKGQKLTPPYVDKYHVAGGYLDEAMTQAIDLNKGVDTYSVIYIKYERNGSSGGGGGGGSSKKTDEDTHGSAEESQKDSEENAGKEIPPVSPLTEGGLEQPQGQNDASLIKGGADPEVTNGKAEGFTPEFQQAYKFAHENGITTKDTIQSAQMNGKLTRIAMAKMLSQYAMNVLGQTPDTSKIVKFSDVTAKRDADYDNGVTLAYQLGIMGQNMPGNKFRPNDEVSRAEFATALSRLLYQTTDGKYKSTKEYYIPHMAKLYNEGIISNTDPSMSERRGYVMIMLMRSAE